MPEADVSELRAFAFGNQRDGCFAVLVALMRGFDDVAIDLSAVVVADDLDGDGVPFVGIDLGFGLREFFGLGGFGDAAHAGHPDAVGADEGATEMQARRYVVPAGKGDLRGVSQAELGGDDEIGGFKFIGAGGVVVVLRQFIAVQRAIGHPPLANARLPAVDRAFPGLGRVLIEGGGDDDFGGLAELGGRRRLREGGGGEEAEKGEEEFHWSWNEGPCSVFSVDRKRRGTALRLFELSDQAGGALAGGGDLVIGQGVARLAPAHQSLEGGLAFFGMGKSEDVAQLMREGTAEGPLTKLAGFDEQASLRGAHASRGFVGPLADDDPLSARGGNALRGATEVGDHIDVHGVAIREFGFEEALQFLDAFRIGLALAVASGLQEKGDGFFAGLAVRRFRTDTLQDPLDLRRGPDAIELGHDGLLDHLGSEPVRHGDALFGHLQIGYEMNLDGNAKSLGLCGCEWRQGAHGSEDQQQGGDMDSAGSHRGLEARTFFADHPARSSIVSLPVVPKRMEAQPQSGVSMPMQPTRFTLAIAAMLGAMSGRVDGAIDAAVESFVSTNCLECHDGDLQRGDLDLEVILEAPMADHLKTWEHALLRMDARQMPPPDEENRPDEAAYEAAVAALAGHLDALAAEHPDPGSPDRIRRLTRVEYQNAIRDLLDLQIDVTELLPKDESSHGFDNITVGTLSPTLLNRYVSAAQKISRLALGHSPGSAVAHIVRLPPDRSQEDHVEGLPPGTRGGTRIPYVFPTGGQYDIEVRLTRDRNEEVEGLARPHDMDVLLDGEPVERFTIKPAKGRDHSQVDAHLKTRVAVTAGAHEVVVTFPAQLTPLLETKRLPYDANFNAHRHPRRSPAVYQVSITGPYEAAAVSATPSRRRVLGDADRTQAGEAEARRLLSQLMRRAYRRTVSAEELAGPMEFFREAAVDGGFEAGMESALASVLVSPRFLFRIEKDPADLASGAVYPLDDFALASRLSFFLWSSLPDDELLDLAEKGELSHPKTLEAQTRRLLADPRSASLVSNFAGQWLHLRNLDSLAPDLRMFPDFDDNLRLAMRRETELFVESILREDRSIFDLLSADYSFLNERLAKHYGIPGIRGSRFRRVEFPPEAHRGGLLRQASILSVTSYANRTSPVIRGNWLLENVLGTPTPPPPPNIPALDDTIVSASLPMRERLAAHSQSKSCAVCHKLMDPIGFALENYDATGRWRILEEGRPVDAAGGFPDGRTFVGADGIEEALLDRPSLFARTVTLKLLTYALGLHPEPEHQPTVRRIVTESAASNHRLSDLIVGITRSLPFTHRKKP